MCRSASQGSAASLLIGEMMWFFDRTCEDGMAGMPCIKEVCRKQQLCERLPSLCWSETDWNENDSELPFNVLEWSGCFSMNKFWKTFFVLETTKGVACLPGFVQ